MDLRDYLGEGAKTGQSFKLSWAFGDLTKGKLTYVGSDRVAVQTEPLDLPFFKGPVEVELTITGFPKAKVVVNGKTDVNAFCVQKNGGLEVYTHLFPNLFQEECFALWRDGKFTNVKLWTKSAGIWSLPLLHAWAYPLDAVVVEEASGFVFDATKVPLLPSQPAA